MRLCSLNPQTTRESLLFEPMHWGVVIVKSDLVWQFPRHFASSISSRLEPSYRVCSHSGRVRPNKVKVMLQGEMGGEARAGTAVNPGSPTAVWAMLSWNRALWEDTLGYTAYFPPGEGHTSVWEPLKCHQEEESLLELLELTYPLLGTHTMTATLLIQYDTSVLRIYIDIYLE